MYCSVCFWASHCTVYVDIFILGVVGDTGYDYADEE